MKMVMTTIREETFEPAFAVVYNNKLDALFLRYHDAESFIEGSMLKHGYAFHRDLFQIIEIMGVK